MGGEEPTREVSDGGTGANESESSSVRETARNWLPATPEYSLSVETHTKYVLALSVALFVFFTVYLSFRYWTYNLTGSDFGSYVHMFATTLSDKGWLLQGKYIASHPYGSYWGGHFSLTLLAFLPVFALFPSPFTLIVSKSFVLAASVVVLWVLARDRLESRRFALLVTYRTRSIPSCGRRGRSISKSKSCCRRCSLEPTTPTRTPTSRASGACYSFRCSRLCCSRTSS